MKIIISENQLRILKRILCEGKINYSEIESSFKRMGYKRIDNIPLTRSLYQPIIKYVKKFDDKIVKGLIFEEDAPNPIIIELVNLGFPDISNCMGADTYGPTKTIYSITNENIDCVLNSIDEEIKK